MSPAPRVPRRDGGFTLVELMVVLVFVAIGILALAGVQTRSSRDVDAGNRRVRATELAQNEMEQIRATGFAPAETDTGQSGPFTWISETDSTDIGLNTVRVTVTWTEKGTPESVELHNLISSR